MGLLAVPAYLLVKLLAYAGWCWYGAKLLAPPTDRSSKRRAITLGLLRVAAGLLAGALLLAVLMAAAPEPTRVGVNLVALLASSAVARWALWCVFGVVVARTGWSFREFAGSGSRQQLWRLGGVAVSFGSDVGLLFGVGALGLIPC